MTTTVNISLPKSLYQDAKKALVSRGYTSISELFRDALRHTLYPHLTENGFTPEFEDAVLEAAAEPLNKSKVWRGTKDIDRYFDRLKKKIDDKNKKNRSV